MPILRSCCLCLDLKVGTKLIGIFALISSLINSLVFAGLVVMFVFMGVTVDTANKLANQPQPSFEDDDYVDVREEQGKNVLELFMDHISSVTIVLYVILALSVLCVITSSMLIHGVKRNHRNLLLPFIGQEIVNIIVLGSLNIWALVVFGTHTSIVSTVLGLFAFIVIHIYLALVVFSQYQALGVIRMHEEISMK